MDSNEPECTPSPSAKSSLFAKPFYASTGRISLSTTTSERLPQSDWPRMESGQLTLFAEDSPAETSQRLDGKQGLPPIVQDYGKKCGDLLAKFNRDSCLWRTSQTSFLESAVAGFQEFSETWPRSGLMQSGIAFQLPTLARPTYAIGFGLLQLQTFRKTVSVPSERFSRDVPCQEEIAAVNGERPCPVFREWAMGFPENWTDLQPSATLSSRKSRKR